VMERRVSAAVVLTRYLFAERSSRKTCQTEAETSFEVSLRTGFVHRVVRVDGAAASARPLCASDGCYLVQRHCRVGSRSSRKAARSCEERLLLSRRAARPIMGDRARVPVAEQLRSRQAGETSALLGVFALLNPVGALFQLIPVCKTFRYLAKRFRGSIGARVFVLEGGKNRIRAYSASGRKLGKSISGAIAVRC
jgi:hypothetical protein